MDNHNNCEECNRDDSSLNSTIDDRHEHNDDQISVLEFLFE